MPLSPALRLRNRSAIVRSQLPDREAADQMADDFRQLVVTAGGVVNEDLLVLGWTQAQITRHGSTARVIALEHTVREVEHPRRRSMARTVARHQAQVSA